MRKVKGFTLIELSLSLVFIATLSLTIAFVINDTVKSYRRGVTLNQVNTTGMDLVDDMRAAIQSSSTKPVSEACLIAYADINNMTSRGDCEENDGENFVTLTRYANVTMGSETLTRVPVYGAFCTGTYSYIWNSGYFFSEKAAISDLNNTPASFKYTNADNNKVTTTDFRLLKIKDESRTVCIAALKDRYDYSDEGLDGLSNMFDISESSEIIVEEPVDLLKTDDGSEGLALYNLYVASPAESTAKNTLFYSVSFILGTIQGGANITKSGDYCAVPTDYENENFDYCAINKFNFAAQATGGKSK